MAALGVEVGRGLALADTAEVVVDGRVVHPATLSHGRLGLMLGYPLTVKY